MPAEPEATTAAEAEPGDAGVYHVVARGQTLWRIAQTYGIDTDRLVEANRLEDATRLEVGQRLFIPGASAVRRVDVPPPAAHVTAADGKWIWPVSDGRILSPFGAPRRTHRHGGVDIAGREGQPVRAARSGRVVYSGSSMRDYGKTIILDHGDGMTTLYAHNSKLVVREGMRVRAGETIARVGRTGNASTEHCHFEVRRNDRTVDPLIYLVPEKGVRR